MKQPRLPMRSDPPLSRRQTAASQDLLTNFGKQLRLLPRRILPLLGASSVACLWVGKSLPRWLRDRSGEFSYEQFVLFSANRIHGPATGARPLPSTMASASVTVNAVGVKQPVSLSHAPALLE